MVNSILGLVTAIFLGALIGLQREFAQQKEHIKRFAGFRTFILITLIGATLGYLSGKVDSLFVIVGFAGVMILVIVSYILGYLKNKECI